MKKETVKTNAIRKVESIGISFKIHNYEVDEQDLSGESVAKKIGMDPDSVFKTLVTHNGQSEFFVFCVPVTCELDLKKAAIASGNKRIELIKMSDLLPLTGYIRGGCSPIGMKKMFPTFIDETAQLYSIISVSSGMRGMQITLSPHDLAQITSAIFTDLI